MQSRLCSVLRSVLALPPSTNMLSLLVEAEILPMTIFHEYDVLRFANSMANLPQTHSARQRFDCDYARSLNDRLNSGNSGGMHRLIDPPRINSFSRTLLDIESRWKVHHADSLDDIRIMAKRLAFEQMIVSVNAHSLFPVLKSSFTTSLHLYLDTFRNARIRSRFRLDRIGCNSQMFRMNQGRVGTSCTSDCVVCPGTEETIAHMIEMCPLYGLPRLILRQLLGGIQSAISTQFVLAACIPSGTWSDKLKRGPARLVLLYTASFLRSICRLRGLTSG
jgi:hypothetical protein